MATTKTQAEPDAAPAPDALPVILARVSRDVGAVRKTQTAPGNIGGFQFRGVDAVVNAVHPHLTAAGVVLLPEVLEHVRESVPRKGGGVMMNVTVRVRFTFHGPAGDSLSLVTLGEAADAGDKASSKAQSVALRVALLQALLLPTDDPDPDTQGYERDDHRPRGLAGQPERAGANPRSMDQAPHRGPRVDARWREAYDALTPGQQEWVRANWPDPRPPADLSTEDVSKALEWLAANCPPASQFGEQPSNPPA